MRRFPGEANLEYVSSFHSEKAVVQKTQFARIDMIRFGLFASFGISSQQALESLVHKLRAASSIKSDVISYSNKGT